MSRLSPKRAPERLEFARAVARRVASLLPHRGDRQRLLERLELEYGVPAGTAKKWLAGHGLAGADAVHLARALGVSTDWLLGLATEQASVARRDFTTSCYQYIEERIGPGLKQDGIGDEFLRAVLATRESVDLRIRNARDQLELGLPRVAEEVRRLAAEKRMRRADLVGAPAPPNSIEPEELVKALEEAAARPRGKVPGLRDIEALSAELRRYSISRSKSLEALQRELDSLPDPDAERNQTKASKRKR